MLRYRSANIVHMLESPPLMAIRYSDSGAHMDDVLVTVFQTSDVLLIAVAKAALETEEIPYVSQSKGLQDWLFPGVHNAVTGPVRFQVAAEDADRAREALEGLDEST
jgi:hypothetical protein